MVDVDVKTLTDVELTELWLSKVVGYKKTPGAEDLIRAIDYEMRERGAERVRAAWHLVASKRADPNYSEKEAAKAELEDLMVSALRKAGVIDDGEEVSP